MHTHPRDPIGSSANPMQRKRLKFWLVVKGTHSGNTTKCRERLASVCSTQPHLLYPPAEAGKQLDIVRTPLVLNDLVGDVHCIIEAMIGRGGAVSLLEPDLSAVPDTVMGDPNRVCGILLNLYTNAGVLTLIRTRKNPKWPMKPRVLWQHTFKLNACSRLRHHRGCALVCCS